LLLPALWGCDIVQGFQDAGDTLFPEQSTHLSSPALRLVSGGYRSLDLAAGRELSVLARSTQSDTSLFVMRFANPEPCEIPDVGRYVASRNPNRTEAGIAYFHDNATQGTLYFADTSCKTFELELEDARLPVGETERSVIVWAGGDLLEVAPEQGKAGVTRLASEVTGVITRAFSGRTLVLTAGRIEVFDSEWKSHGQFGDSVVGLIRTNQGVLYLDKSGMRRLSAGASNSTTEDALIVADACNLAMRDDKWATFYAPCAEKRLRVLREPSGELYDLKLNADSLNFYLLPARDSPGGDPTKDPFWFVFLRDTDTTSTFVVRDPQGAEHVIGDNATLGYFDLNDSTDEPYGYALVNVADRVGDYVYFDFAGKRHTLAHGAYTRGDRLLVDWNGSTGSLASTSGDRLAIVATGVPERAFEFTDASKQWTVLFHDYDGEQGRLSRFIGNLDALRGTPASAPFRAPELEEIAPSVGIFTTASLGTLIPGASFLADYDTEKGTGRLTYENAELRFKAVVDNGVSDYLITSDYLLYTIPEGRDRGIWLATGK
jgi:hypothetical protein